MVKNFKSVAMTALAALSVAASPVATAQMSVSPTPQKANLSRGFRPVSRVAAPSMSSMNGLSAAVKSRTKAKANSSLPVIYGSVIFSETWGSLPDGSTTPYGCYAVVPADVMTPEEILVNPELMINGGGCYSDRKIHYRLYYLAGDDENQSFINYYTVVNTDEWSYVVEPIMSQVDNTVANDMTYDRTTGKIFASVWGNFDGTYSRFAEVNPLTGETDELSTITEMAVIAANNFGEIYAVTMNTGILCRIDKTTGTVVEIGPTGLNPYYAQSATVDPATNTIYWAAQTQSGGGLYTLDTSTGHADFVGRFSGDEEFTCLFIEDDVKGLNAPGELKSFTARHDGTKTAVTFSLPLNAFDGSTLSGNLDVYVYADGGQVVKSTGKPGETVSFNLNLGDGDHSIVAYAQNAAGYGPKTTVRHFAGLDVPGAVGNLHLDIADGQATLSWQAPEAGLNGGSIDTESLKYNIVRYPGGNVCAQGHTGNSFSENLPAGVANYYYTVTSVNAQGEGGTATSNSVFTGTTFELPYVNDFSTAESLVGFTVIDGDKNGYSWEWKHLTPSGSDPQDIVWTRYNATEQCNDWLILPPINFLASGEYQLRFKARVFDYESPERFEVKIGQAASAEAMTRTILPAVETKSEAFQTYSVSFKVDKDGAAYIAFHCISPAQSYRLILDDVEITATATAEVPAAVGELKAEADPTGLPTVKISFRTPKLNYSGEVLNELTQVAIYRNDDITPIYSLDNPPKDYLLTWTDEAAPEGNVSYRVICSNSAGQSPEASVTVFVGLDKPEPVGNLKLANVDENAVISWSAPTSTVNGQAVNPSLLTYKVIRNDGVVVAQDIQETTVTDIYYSDAPAQIMCYYQVNAVYGGEIASDPAVTNAVIFGPDYTVPFKEGFPYDDEVGGHVFDNLPWVLSRITNHTTAHWGPKRVGVYPEASASDGDGGLVSFLSFDLPAGETERLSSSRINLADAVYPRLSFDLFRTTLDADEVLTVEISHNDGNFETLGVYPIKGDKSGWETVTIDIPRRHCLPQSQISFLATTARGYNIHIDNIRVENGEAPQFDYDLDAVDLTVPDLRPNEEATVVLRAYNAGTMAVKNYKVELIVNGVSAMSKTYDGDDTAIAPGEEMEFHFTLTPEDSDLNRTFVFQGHVEAAGDQNPDNDYSIKRSVIVGVDGIMAVEADGNGAEAEYYDISGRRVAKPSAGSFYIVRRGNEVSKQIMK